MKTIHPQQHPLYDAEIHLRQCDPLFEKGITAYGICSLLHNSSSHFHILIKTIIDQQLSVKVAERIAENLLKAQAGSEFMPVSLLELPEESYRNCGLSRNKIRYIRFLAQAVVDSSLRLEALEKHNEGEIIKQLMVYPGIGLWTAEIFLMFALKRLDILPLGDLAIRNAIKQHYAVEASDAIEVYYQATQHWRPYRSIACWYLWKMVD